jgi:hypothetical protein
MRHETPDEYADYEDEEAFANEDEGMSADALVEQYTRWRRKGALLILGALLFAVVGILVLSLLPSP